MKTKEKSEISNSIYQKLLGKKRKLNLRHREGRKIQRFKQKLMK
jgi:hypothetical protein